MQQKGGQVQLLQHLCFLMHYKKTFISKSFHLRKLQDQLNAELTHSLFVRSLMQQVSSLVLHLTSLTISEVQSFVTFCNM
jgi:hypothetical protein